MSLVDVCYVLILPRTPYMSISDPQGAADHTLRTAALNHSENQSKLA